jgi:outer membrane biosynthesis protein TonB
MNVSQFSAFTTVLALCVAVSPALAQTHSLDLVLPVVKSAEMPLYPHLARVARIERTARMQVWTDGSSIVKVDGSGAHKLLMDAAEKNLRTWRFYPHKPRTFTVTFTFKLEQPRL